MLAQLELVGKWKDKDAIFLVENEDKVNSEEVIWKIHKILNHKSKEQMHYAFKNAGKLNEETRKKIDEEVDKCEIGKKNGCSKSKPTVAIPKATDFNSTVSIDLKIVGESIYCGWFAHVQDSYKEGY